MGERSPIIVGIDEAGRGPLAGPVVAAAVIFTESIKSEDSSVFPIDLMGKLKDSKKLSPKQREELFKIITTTCDYGIGIINHKKIDEINILQATFEAMRKAIKNLQKKMPQKSSEEASALPSLYIQVDGNKTIPGLKIKQEAIVKGDQKIKEISAASIIAKVTRDRIMEDLDKKHPAYGFARHKGYGTKFHIEMLKKYGRSKVHRKSFKF